MRKGSYLIIIFFIFLVLFIVTAASFVYIGIGKAPSIKANSYLEISLGGELVEKSSPDILSSFYLRPTALSMYDIWTNFQKAKNDTRIKGVVLRLGYLVCDWAKINEIRDLVTDFRQSGKKVYAYVSESIEFDKEYYLATACDKIVLHPQGMLVINGIGGYVPFVKQTLDKLGIEAEVEHVEEYKTAYHMFTKQGMTPAHREMLDAIYKSIYSQYVETVAGARSKTPDEIRELLDHGFFQGEQAKEAGLVDALLYEDQFQDLLLDDQKRIHTISHNQYLKTRPASYGFDKGKKIALIYGTGTIVSGEGMYSMMGSATISRQIRRARKDRSIAAIVLRVDSPGGSAVASDTIWREVTLAKIEKPFIVSMSDLAGSGGYQIAMAAHKIVAHPQTLTGSIGVIFTKLNLTNLYDKLGITSERIQYGKRADMFTTFRSATPEERAMLRQEILRMYDHFVTKAAEGRNLSKDDIQRVAKGRVWTGSQALDHGLVDEMGGLSRAIALAKELAGIPEKDSVSLQVWPKKVSFFDMMMGRRVAKFDLGLEPRMQKVLFTFQLLRNEAPWALMPFWLPHD